MDTLTGKVAIVGVDESDEIGVVPQKTALQLHAEAAQNALADAGIEKDEVDGLFTAGLSTIELGEYLGIRPTYTDGTNVGGSSFVIHIGHAVNAIANGLCRVALISHGQSGRSRQSGPPPDLYGQNVAQFEEPVGTAASAGRLRDGLRAPHAPLRHDARATGRDRGRDAQVGVTEPKGADARSADHRRRAGEPLD